MSSSTVTQSTDLVVYLIDDDPTVLHSQTELLRAAGLTVDAYRSAESFLSVITQRTAGCVITDLKLAGMSGLDLQRELVASHSPLPLIVVSGYADVQTAVQLMENGAVTLLQKPYDAQELLSAVHRALDQFQYDRDRDAEIRSIQKRLNSLTLGEMSVLELLVKGRPNKAISTQLEISMRTVDRRRSIVLEKMQVASAPELARLVTIVETARDPH
ncbi:MAG: response regulator [Planctomycetota bacterium]|nr:response regulator [Planctomycetota bacterium]MDA1161787.1 response regulator [Planctomycetota bacterium]